MDIFNFANLKAMLTNNLSMGTLILSYIKYDIYSEKLFHYLGNIRPFIQIIGYFLNECCPTFLTKIRRYSMVQVTIGRSPMELYQNDCMGTF